MSAAIEINNISFAYPGYPPCISNLNLTINQGERFGLFGPNGAGKTTLMQLMTGLLTYQKGSIQLLGNEIKKHDKRVNHLLVLYRRIFLFIMN
jgi:ABC-2 type transport system ATP-binding protein